MGIIRDQIENERIAKAKLNGDNTQPFKIADAVNADEAVSKGQLDSRLAGINIPSSTLDTSKMCIIYDEKPSGVNSQSIVVGWNTKQLNTVKINNIGAILSSNQVTLQAGTYYVEGDSRALFVGLNRFALYNVTASTYDIVGINNYARNVGDIYDAMASTAAVFSGIITISSPTVFEARHYIQTAYSFTFAMVDGQPELYTTLKIWKVS